ncbi:MAG: hypothetical protein IT162_19515 [Bryobacterales bacterium]|nr:hypothetical protein [Bryobacterales bacterium]
MPIYNGEGQILVKAGDSISKYHMSIFGSYGDKKSWEKAFGRPPLKGATKARGIEDFNRIDTGETILYLPVWNKKHGPGIVIPVPASGPLTQEELDMLISRLNFEVGFSANIAEKYAYRLAKMKLGGEDAVTGIELVEAAVKYMKYAKNAYDTVRLGARLPADLAKAVEPFTFLGIATSAASWFAAWINARKMGLKYVTLRATAYGMTSFAYGDPPPAYPQSLRRNHSAGPIVDPTLTVADFAREWDAAVANARQGLRNLAPIKNTTKPCIQTSLVFTASNAKELCKLGMAHMERKYLSESNLPFLPPIVRDSVHMAFWSPEPDYPN